MTRINHPKTVQVGPWKMAVLIGEEEIETIRDKFNDEDSVGFTDLEGQGIFVDPALSYDRKVETLLHEVLHAVFCMVGGDAHYDEIEEEKIIRIFSAGLLDTLRRNPKLVEYLIQK